MTVMKLTAWKQGEATSFYDREKKVNSEIPITMAIIAMNELLEEADTEGRLNIRRIEITFVP